MGEGAGPVIAAVGDLLPVLRERAQEAEDARTVPAESVKALTDSGFFRLLQPASHGGLEADPMTFYTAVRMIASACDTVGARRQTSNFCLSSGSSAGSTALPTMYSTTS